MRRFTQVLLTLCALVTLGCSPDNPVETIEGATPIPKPTETSPTIPSFRPTRFLPPNTYQHFRAVLPDKFKDTVDTEFNALQDKAGISIAVYTDNTLWTYATGDADVAIPMTTNTPLFISSTSKTFLSALVLTQIENGLYHITDPLSIVLENHPGFASVNTKQINRDVTVHELLTMSSGLPNFNKNIEGKSGSFKQASWSPLDTLKLVQTNFITPGKFEYNDTNAILLGIIAEFHGEAPLAELYREAFYKPLGITATTLPEDGIRWHPNLFDDPMNDWTIPETARPYTDISRWAEGFGNMIHAAPFEFGYYVGAVGRLRYACCGIVSTPENIARWAYELYSTQGTAISQSARTDLINSFAPERIPPWNRPRGTPEEYGFLIAKKVFTLTDKREITAYGHRGGGGGYTSWMYYSPELDVSISILTNSDRTGLHGMCKVENPGDCIALSIFTSYSRFLEQESLESNQK